MMKYTKILFASLFFFNFAVIGADQIAPETPFAGSAAMLSASTADGKDVVKKDVQPPVFNWRGPESYGPLGQEPRPRGQDAEVKTGSTDRQSDQHATENGAGVESGSTPEQARPMVGCMVQGWTGPISYLPSLQGQPDFNYVQRFDDDSHSDTRFEDEGSGWRRRRDLDDDRRDFGRRWKADDERNCCGGPRGEWRDRRSGIGACDCSCPCCSSGHCDGGKFRDMMPHDEERGDHCPRRRFNDRGDDSSDGYRDSQNSRASEPDQISGPHPVYLPGPVTPPAAPEASPTPK